MKSWLLVPPESTIVSRLPHGIGELKDKVINKCSRNQEEKKATLEMKLTPTTVGSFTVVAFWRS